MQNTQKPTSPATCARTLLHTVLLATAGLTIATTPLKADQPELTYLDRFTNTTWNDRSINDLGWNAYYLNPVGLPGAQPGPAVGIELLTTGSGTGVQIFNSWDRGPLPNTTGRGFLGSQTWFPMMRYATIHTFSTAIDAGTFTWDMGASSVSQEVRILVQSNGTWYASSSVFTTTELIPDRATFQEQTSGNAAIGKSFSFEAGVTLWHVASIGAGESMLLSSSTTTLASNLIDGIGFYYHNNENPREWQTQRVFIDNLAAYSSPIPEPATVAAALGGVSLLVAGALRRRKACKRQA